MNGGCFYLGTDAPSWLADMRVPLFVSHRRIRHRRRMPRAAVRWALDSGAFSEVSTLGQFETTPAQYVAAVRRYRDEIGRLDWAAPQDHMCEPWVLARSRIATTTVEAQRYTVDNYLTLRALDETLPIVPVLQGQTTTDYLAHAAMYETAGVDLPGEPLVGVGSVCRRQATDDVAQIIAALGHLRLHGFGVKSVGLARYGWMLASADSMAWSYGGRRVRPCPRRPTLASCNHCRHYALAWRDQVIDHMARRDPVAVRLFDVDTIGR